MRVPAPAAAVHPSRRTGVLLWHRDFRLLWAGETVSQAGSAMATVAMPLLAIADLHASTFLVSALTAAAYLPWLIIGLPTGAWVDRLDCRKLMLACDAASALLYASLPLATWLGILTMSQVMAVALPCWRELRTCCSGPPIRYSCPPWWHRGELVEGNAKLQAISSAAQIGGPGIAGVTAAAVGAAVSLLGNSASFLVSAACLVAIRDGRPRQRGEAPRDGVRQEIAEGIGYVARDSWLRPLTIWAALVNLCLAGYSALAVVFLVRVADLGPGLVGVLLAGSGIGGVLGALGTGWISRRYGTAGALRLTAFGGMPFALLIPVAGPGWRALLYLAGALITFAAVASSAVILSTFRQVICPPHLLGRVVATMRFVLYGVRPLARCLAAYWPPCSASGTPCGSCWAQPCFPEYAC